MSGKIKKIHNTIKHRNKNGSSNGLLERQKKAGGFIPAPFKNINVQNTDAPAGLKKVSESQKLPDLRKPTGIPYVFKQCRIKQGIVMKYSKKCR